MGEKIFIEVKTTLSKKDTGFYFTNKELYVISGNDKKIDPRYYYIYYVKISDGEANIKIIDSKTFSKYKIDPVLYQVTSTEEIANI